MEQLQIDINDIVNSLTEQLANVSRERAMLQAQVNALFKKLEEVEGAPEESEA